MKKIFFLFLYITLPLGSYSINLCASINAEDIFLCVPLILILFVVWIFIDNNIINNKKKGKSKNKVVNNSSNDKNRGKKPYIQKLEDKIETLKDEIETLKDEIETLKDEKVTLEDELRKKSAIIDNLKAQITSHNNMVNWGNNNQSEKSNVDLTAANKTEDKGARPGSIYLTVINGNIAKAEPDQTIYYRSWKENGQLLFEFVNNERTRKAINNRTILIEPFCIKLEISKSPDLSEEIETKNPGILNEDFSISKKAEIIYK